MGEHGVQAVHLWVGSIERNLVHGRGGWQEVCVQDEWDEGTRG
jgi:hypothetical protein